MYKFLLLLVFIFSCNSNLLSQNNRDKEIDSLQQVLNSHKAEDSIRVDILTDLNEKLMFSNPELAKKYAEEELKISQKINYQIGIGKGNLHLGNYFVNRNNNDSALHYYNKAKNIFVLQNNTRGIIFVNYSISDIERIKGNYDTAINMTKENLELINQNESNPISRAKFSGAQHNSLAVIYMEKGSNKLALLEALKAYDLFDEINDNVRKADVLKLLGDLEYTRENYNESLSYFNEAINVYKSEDDDFYMAYALNTAGKALKELNKIEEAKNYQNQVLELAKKNKAQATQAFALNDLGELSIINKEYNEARKYFLEALKITTKEDIKTGVISAYLGLAKTNRLTNNNQKALSNIDNALSIAESSGAKSYLANIYKERSKIFENLNMLKQSINNLKQSHKLNDSIFSIKKIQQIDELSTIYETEKKEAAIALQDQQIKALNQEVEISKLRKGLYAGGMFTFLAVSGLLFFGFKQRIKKNKIEQEKQEEIYKQEIAFKKKELASQTLHLVQKNTFIQELKENLEKIKQSPELFKIEFRRLVMLLKKESAEDKDWEVFKSYFAEVHNNFDNQLKSIYADITEKEIRLASFLRMNLSTKEIASMLNVLPDSVLKSKYRLKKKLKLDKHTDLNQFLNSL
jgi:tetratricopeptide (TPR) repeat protein